jgi:endonuclease/exonuclease/phosphatase family metal-dependent hydrolase
MTRRSMLLAARIVLAVAIGAGVTSRALQPEGDASVFAMDASGDVRLMTWNVGDNSFIANRRVLSERVVEGRPGQFARILRAVRPDVLCLQQVTSDPEDVARFVTDVLPPGAGHAWQAHAILDNVIVSRFPLVSRGGRTFTQGRLRRGHAVALVDLPDGRHPRDLSVTCVHFQSNTGRAEMSLRQRQADAIVSWIRDAKSAGGAVTLAPGTPLVIAGDFNVIEQPSPSLNTLLTGDIVEEQRFGADIRPDWDGSDLTDILPHHNESGAETYTWRDDTQPFPPGALDRILYSDSVIRVGRSFVLDTTRMTGGERKRAGLQATDTMRDPAKGVHDHLPVVADLIMPDATLPSAAPPG